MRLVIILNMGNISKYDALKIKAVFLYTLNELKEADMITIFKIIYFANKKHLAKWGEPIFKDTFYAFEQGPVPSFLYDAIKFVQSRISEQYQKDNGSILIGSFKQEWSNGLAHLIAIEKPDLNHLSKSMIESIEESLKENKGISPEELSSKSHDQAWQTTDRNLPMNTLNIAYASGASEGTINYLKEIQEVELLINM